MRKLVIGLSLILLFLNSWGKANLTQLYFDHLTIDDRLSHNTVYGIIQDRIGYVWIGTQDGLNRYDGYSFEVFRSNGEVAGKSGFVGKTISSLLEDQAGNIWVGTRKYGVNIKKAKSDQFINLGTDSAFLPIQGHDISSIFEDSKGLMWFTTVGRGLLSYDPVSGQSKHYSAQNSGLSNDLVFDIVEDNEGGIWVATAGVGINYLGGNGKFSISPRLLEGNSNLAGYRKTLCIDGNTLWVGTEGSGLYKVDIKNRSFVQLLYEDGPHKLPSNGIRDLHLSKEGHLYIAIDGEGLGVYDIKEDTLYLYQHQVRELNSLNTNALLCFGKDRSDNLWIGTFNGGINLHKAHKTRFDFLSPDVHVFDKLQKRSVLALYQPDDANIWVGTDGGGIYLLEPKSRLFSRLKIKGEASQTEMLTKIVAKTIFQDSRQNIWIGTFRDGIIRYDPITQSIEQYQNQFWNPKSLGENNVWAIDEDKAGRIWIATLGGGVSVWNPQSNDFTIYPPTDSAAYTLADANVMTIHIDQADRVWIGTIGRGLNVWNRTKNEFLHITHNIEDSLSISNDEIRVIFEDSKGNIWIGTEGGGLNKWLGEVDFQRIGTQDGLIGNNVMGIVEDENGMLWISSFEGISQLDPTSMQIRSFDFRGGDKSNQFNQLASLCDREGNLYFGGIKGLNSIQPEQIKNHEAKPNIFLTDLKVFNRSVPVGEITGNRVILSQSIESTERINLDYTDNSFSLSFTSTDFVNPEENQFEYIMEGFDVDWQQTSIGQHSVTYTNLAPKEYQFRLRHRGQEISKTVIIRPPFWQTIWFKILMSLIIIGAILTSVWVIVRRRENLHKQQMLEASSEILQLRNEKLAEAVEAKNSKLMFFSVQMAHKNEVLTKVKSKIQATEEETPSANQRIIQLLDRELKSEDYWSEFNLYFNQVDKDFLQSLQATHPDLTQNDLRICSLIRINLTTKEIASLLNITVRGVEQSRYRLKKRLGLESEDNLPRYIAEFRGESSRKS